ncbi:hypothetical protein DJ62_3524 [Yersinia enterocolitica]|nr:hypothetical protein DJ62_3524 [Yersinia enterocolitica]
MCHYTFCISKVCGQHIGRCRRRNRNRLQIIVNHMKSLTYVFRLASVGYLFWDKSHPLYCVEKIPTQVNLCSDG